MVNHIVLWNIKGDLSVQEKREAALTIKSKLEAVAQKVEGVISLEVVINEMESSNRLRRSGSPGYRYLPES